MVILEITLEALPDKHGELERALRSMILDMRGNVGCQSAEVFRQLESLNDNRIITEWETREALDRYIASDAFSALLGSRILLARDPRIRLYAVAAQEADECVLAVRSLNHRSEADST